MPAYDNTLSSTLGGYPLDCGYLKGIFGWVDFREYEKKKKIEEKTFLVGIWLEGGEGKKLVMPTCFLPGLTKMFYLQNWEKTRQGF